MPLYIPFTRFLPALILTACFCLPAVGERIVLPAKSPSQKQESLVWEVHKNVSKLQVDVLQGRPIVNTVKILGGEEFRVGSYLEPGQNWNQDLGESRSVGQVRVNVDKAQGSQLQLVIWTNPSGAKQVGAASASTDWAIKRPTEKKQSLIWDVNQSIRGFEVFVTAGRPIINTVKFLGGEEFAAGAYIDAGHSFRKDFDHPVPVGQLRVNVDKALGSELKLVIRK